VRIHDAGHVRGGIVTFSHEGITSEDLRVALSAEKINTSLSNIYSTYLDQAIEDLGTYIRASVHYITTDEEIDRLVDVVAGTSA
jgi:selenocysteine lyase/cysteine desulfurase